MINWSRVNELREEVGQEDFDEVVTLFLSEVEERLEEMIIAARNSEDDMHFLKGSALNLGFVQLAELCQKGETMASSGSAPTITAEEIIAVYTESKTHFLQQEARHVA